MGSFVCILMCAAGEARGAVGGPEDGGREPGMGSFLCIWRICGRGFGFGVWRGLRQGLGGLSGAPGARLFGGGALEFLDGGEDLEDLA